MFRGSFLAAGAPAVVLAAALAAPVSAGTPAAAGQVRFRVSVEEVLVEVVVAGGGRPVAGLTAADFTVLDEGVRREVRLVPQGELPVSVLFLMDLSESVSGERRRLLAAAAEQFAGQLSERDRCGVAVFASEVSLARDFAGCSLLPADPFPDREITGGTALWDSLLLSAALVEEAPGRAVLVIFTDGEDTMSWTPEAFVEEALRGSGAVLYAVIPPDARGTARAPHRYRSVDRAPPSVARRRRIGIRRMNGGVAPDEIAVLLDGPRRARRPRTGARLPSELQLLRQVVEASGGRMVRSRDEKRLVAAYGEILDEMRSRYVLAFQPDPDRPPGWRRLEVSVDRDGAEVRARRGYLHRGPEPEAGGPGAGGR